MPAAPPARRKRQPIRRRTPQQDRARTTVDTILEAAARILRQHGLGALNTNRIATRAGISVGTLYGYFPDKTAILVALARRLMADDQAALLAAAAEDAAGEPIRSVLRALISRHRHDRALRRAAMSVHLGAGGAAEHADAVARFVLTLIERNNLLFGPAGPPSPFRLFIATRAALGVARSLVDESPHADDADLEDELVRLVYGYLGLA